VVKLYLNSAPPNGVGIEPYALVYKHLTPNGVKTVVDAPVTPACPLMARWAGGAGPGLRARC
jgi:hypothetical protein